MEFFYYLNIFWANNIVQGIVAILIAVILAFVTDYLIWFYVKRITNKTHTHVDDFLVNVLTTPIHWIIIILGAKKAFLKIFDIILTKNVDLYYKIAIIALVAYVLSKLLSFFIGHWLKTQKQTKKIPQYVSNIVGVMVFLIALMIVLSMLKISITPLLTSFGIAGILMGLSLQNTLVNFIAGLKIISEEKIKIGDFVDDGTSIKGVVEDMSLNSTKIRNLNNNIIIVPNSKISDNPITNYSRNDSKIRVIVPITIVIEKPLSEIKEKLQKIVMEVFNTMEGIDKRKAPEVWIVNAGQTSSMTLPTATFNILITVISYKYQFGVADEILSRTSKNFWK